MEPFLSELANSRSKRGGSWSRVFWWWRRPTPTSPGGFGYSFYRMDIVDQNPARSTEYLYENELHKPCGCSRALKGCHRRKIHGRSMWQNPWHVCTVLSTVVGQIQSAEDCIVEDLLLWHIRPCTRGFVTVIASANVVRRATMDEWLLLCQAELIGIMYANECCDILLVEQAPKRSN